MSDIATMMQAANPVPDSEAALTDDDFDALLLLTQSRSGNVEVQELTKPAEPEKNQRRGWMVAAAAFAAVIVLVGAAMLLTNTTEELPPATTPPTTQAVTPTTMAATEEAPTEALSVPTQEFVDGFFAAFNSGTYAVYPGDYESYLGFFASDAIIDTGMVLDGDLDRYREELAFRGAMNYQLTVVSCREEFGLRCEVDATSDDLYSLADSSRISVGMDVENGVIVSMTWNEDLHEIGRVVTPFYEWMSAKHPGTLELMRSSGSPGAPLLTEESINLWLEYLPEYKVTLDQ